MLDRAHAEQGTDRQARTELEPHPLPGLSPAARITAMISSTVGGSGGYRRPRCPNPPPNLPFHEAGSQKHSQPVGAQPVARSA
jgi:hypothetical protein